MDNYDVVIIGGGIHGVGVAQAAAAAGYSALLLEKNALAYGSSSRSSKLIHGGLRYLESAQFSLVYECLHERQLLAKLAPDLVYLESFHIPVYRTTSRSRLTIRTGLSLYALLGGLTSAARFNTLPKKQWDSLDGLEQHDLTAVFRYFDGRTDDAALTRAVMNSAITLGAEMLMPAEFVGAACEQDNVQITYVVDGITKQCQASALINATGAWINPVLEKINPVCKAKEIDLVQGTHLILDNVPIDHCFYLEAPQDKRAVFVLPWKNKTLVGTTETRFTGSPDSVKPEPLERDYLLTVVRHYFPAYSAEVSSGLAVQKKTIQVGDAFAGLRVLPAGSENDFSKPRDTVLYQSHNRIINVYGGKLTTYRLTADRIIKKIQDVLPVRKQVALTRNINLEA